MIQAYYNKTITLIKYTIDRWGKKTEASSVDIQVRMRNKYNLRRGINGKDIVSNMEIMTKQTGISLDDIFLIDAVRYPIIWIEPVYRFKTLAYNKVGC